MNTGAEAVETALKLCRKWAYEVKGIPENQAQIIVCENNFHGKLLLLFRSQMMKNAKALDHLQLVLLKFLMMIQML
jgi:ornithine--oxo-acid transaminase